MGVLDGIRVIELPGLAGAYCGKLLADLGAQVTKVEPPEGDPGRFVGPFAKDTGVSLWFTNFHLNKTITSGDYLPMVREADVVIESFPPGTVRYEALRAVNPNIVLTSITPFGQTGPNSVYAGGDLVAAAMSGLLSGQGDPDRPPCAPPLDQGLQLAGVHAAMATLYVLHGGAGDHVDISIQEVLAHMNFTIARYDVDAAVQPRPGEKGLQPGINIYQAKDGWVNMYARRWSRLVEWAGIEELEDPRWNERTFREDHEREADKLINGFMASWEVIKAMEVGQGRGIAVSPMNSHADFTNSPHIAERKWFRSVQHPVLGEIQYPGPPYRLSETEPAPRRKYPPRKRPFDGIRVVDFTVAFAGPFAVRYLAELGAEVLRVESTKAATNTEDSFRRQFEGGRSAQSMEINRSKRSITLDLHRPEAQELALRLAEKSDIAINNLRPGTLARWNLGYEQISAVNPGIIVVDMPGFGISGPYRNYVSLGQTLMGNTGLTRLWGHPDSPPNRHCKLAYPDWIGAGHAAVAVLAALNYRMRTGRGQYIEVAQLEATAAMQGVAYLDYVVNGNVWEPAGSRHQTFAPHNVYPCRGEDRWVAIEITNDDEWGRLVRVLNATEWASEDAAVRKAHEDEIDARIAEWTAQYTPHQAMRLLQKAGVPAGAVQNGEDLWHDPHLRARGYTVSVDQPFIGPVVQSGLTWRFESTPEVTPRGGPRMGEANEYVFCYILGFTPQHLAELVAKEVVV